MWLGFDDTLSNVVGQMSQTMTASNSSCTGSSTTYRYLYDVRIYARISETMRMTSEFVFRLFIPSGAISDAPFDIKILCLPSAIPRLYTIRSLAVRTHARKSRRPHTLQIVQNELPTKFAGSHPRHRRHSSSSKRNAQTSIAKFAKRTLPIRRPYWPIAWGHHPHLPSSLSKTLRGTPILPCRELGPQGARTRRSLRL